MKTALNCAAAWLAMAALGASPSLAVPDEPAELAMPSEGRHGAPGAGAAPGVADIDLSALLARAVAAYEAGDLVSARALFAVVHAHAPTARTLRSLGIVAYRQARFSEAHELLAASLVSDVRPLTEAQAEGVRVLIADIEARPGRGAAPTPEPAPARPALAEPGADAPPPALPEPAHAASAPPSPAPSRSPSRSRRVRRTGYALLGTGALTLVASATLTGLAYARLHQLEVHCRSEGGCTDSEVRAAVDGRHLNVLANLGLAAGLTGGLSSVAGLTLLVLPARREAAAATVQLGWLRTF